MENSMSKDLPYRTLIEREGEPPVIYIPDNLPEMSLAIEKARSTVDQFISALETPKSAQTNFSVKLPVVDGDKVEHMWVLPVRYQEDCFFGTINNEPDKVSTVKVGDEVSIAKNEISDWMYVDNGRLVGGFTLRVLRKHMSEEERKDVDEQSPFVIADDINPDKPLVRFFDAIGNSEYEVMLSLLKTYPKFANRAGKVAVRGVLGDMRIESQPPLSYAVYWGNTKAVKILFTVGLIPRQLAAAL